MSSSNEQRNNAEYEYIVSEQDGKKVRTRVRKKVRYTVDKDGAHSHSRSRSHSHKKRRKSSNIFKRLFANNKESEAGMPLLWLSLVILVIGIPILIFLFEFLRNITTIKY